MRIFICSSKSFYGQVLKIKQRLEVFGHKITLPNSFEDPFKEEKMKKVSKEAHVKWKSEKLKLQTKKVNENEAILVLNLEKKGIPNYIGGATFLEIFKGWELNKKIFLYNPLPSCSFTDELTAMKPIILNGNLRDLK